MKKWLFMALSALMMLGCGKSERLLTSATGSIYECLVVCDGAPLREAVSATMGADMEGALRMRTLLPAT